MNTKCLMAGTVLAILILTTTATAFDEPFNAAFSTVYGQITDGGAGVNGVTVSLAASGVTLTAVTMTNNRGEPGFYIFELANFPNIADGTQMTLSAAIGTRTVSTVIIKSSNDMSAALDISGITVQPVLTTITVSPATVSLNVSNTATFTASPKDQIGNPIAAAVTWSSSNNTVGTIDATGLFKALNPGSTTINATSGSVAGSAIATVNPVSVLKTITVSPATTSLTVGSNATFTATPKDQFGNPIAAAVTWSSSNITVGKIDPVTGLFTALAAGTTIVNATSGTVVGNATVTVVQAFPKPGVLNALNITSPGGSVWLGDTLTGHLWVSDHLRGFCRLDAQPNGIFAINASTCIIAPSGPISPGQPAYDPATNSVYVPDNSAKSTGVWRLTYNPVSQTMTSAAVVAPKAGLGGNVPTATAFGPDSNLYVGFLKTGTIIKIANPTGTQTVSTFGKTSNGKGVIGLAFAGSNLYIAESASVTRIGLTGGKATNMPIPVTAPTAIAASANVIFVADTPVNVSSILRFNLSTNFKDLYSNSGLMPDGTLIPYRFVSGLSLDSVTTRLFVGDDPTKGAQLMQGHIWIVPNALAQYCENPNDKDIPCRGNKINK